MSSSIGDDDGGVEQALQSVLCPWYPQAPWPVCCRISLVLEQSLCMLCVLFKLILLRPEEETDEAVAAW